MNKSQVKLMRFFNNFSIALSLFLALFATAQEPEQTVKTFDQIAVQIAEQAKVGTDKTKSQLEQSGVLSRFSEQGVAKQIEQYRNAAQLLAENSQLEMSKLINTEFGFDEKTARSFNGDGTDMGEDIEIKAIFISFSMSRKEIEEAMKAAVSENAVTYLNGIGVKHKGIHDTIKELQLIGSSLKTKPDVRFKPKLFAKHNIQKVPTILYQANEKVLLAEGILNLGWLKAKHAQQSESGFIGNYGKVYQVQEESLLKTLRSRMEGYDWTGKREQAIAGFWKKQQFRTLPKAEKNEHWYIDPTVKVLNDIKNPNGDYLAKQGQTVNPLSEAKLPLTLYVFNPTDQKQLEWTHAKLMSDANAGQVMLLFSEINKEKGWEHLGALRKHFSRELYQLPQELISKFDLTGLPAKISTDLSRQVLKIEQFKLED